jgi:hypothetical protein
MSVESPPEPPPLAPAREGACHDAAKLLDNYPRLGCRVPGAPCLAFETWESTNESRPYSYASASIGSLRDATHAG